MESSGLFEELPFHQWDFATDYNCLSVCSRAIPPPSHVDAEGHEWYMYANEGCWSNYAWGVVVHGTCDAFGKITIRHVSGDIAMVRDALSLSPPARHGASSLL